MKNLGLETKEGLAVTGVKAYLNEEERKECKSGSHRGTGCAPHPGT